MAGDVPTVHDRRPVEPAVGHHVVPLHGRRAGRVGRTTARGGDRPRLPSRCRRLPGRGPGLDRRATPCRASTHGGRGCRFRRSGRGPFTFFVEAASNPSFPRLPALGQLGSLSTAGDAPLYRLRHASIGRRDDDVFDLLLDVEVLARADARSLPADEAPADGCCASSRPRSTSSTRRRRRPPQRRPPVAAARTGAAAREPARIRSSPSATRTSTPPGCGRSARRCASVRARSPRRSA